MITPNEFVDERFPVDIAFGSTGGPQRNTQIITLGSGRERRNQKWSSSRRSYDAGYGVKNLDALYQVVAFFEARRGPLVAFRFRDPIDWKSCDPLSSISPTDQIIGIGDGVTDRFPLIKTYGTGDNAYQRPISRPVTTSVVVAVDEIAFSAPIEFELDTENAEIVFQPGHIPANGAIVTAGFEFDVPVRFGSDQLSISLAAFNAGEVPSIPLQEVLL
ncbi:MAG: DUF2460 domain-containing protein [Pseudomonadota bacterium]